jgi:IS4 transposase
MRFTASILGKLVEPIDRRRFQTIVDSHDGDAYDEAFRSWDHLMVLIHAQFSGADSLRGLEAGWNANSHHHYHLGSGALRRSTLSDASRRRPAAVFAETFGLLAGHLDRRMRRDGAALLRLIDSTPIPLGKVCGWAARTAASAA